MFAIRSADTRIAGLPPAVKALFPPAAAALLFSMFAGITLRADDTPAADRQSGVDSQAGAESQAGTVSQAPTKSAPAKAIAGKPFHRIQDDVRAALRRESESKSVADRSKAVYELIELHRAIVADERFRTSDMMKGFRKQVASRLLAVAGEIQRQLYRERSEKSAKPAAPAKVAGGRGSNGRSGDLASLADQTLPPTGAVSDSWTDLLALAGASQGGPLWLVLEGGSMAGRPGGPAVAGDWGPALVDLIQRTIHPDFWDVQGGPGTIVYYAPLHCLVVRATAEVHGDVGVVIGGLRRVRP